MSGPVVIAGATGFVGRQLVRRMAGGAHTLRCGSRTPERAAARAPEHEWVRLDVEDADSLHAAFAGAHALVYLVHQMGAHHGDLAEQEAASAHRVRDAAAQAGLQRIVYLGGPRPTSGPPSPHLAARLATGEILRAGPVHTIELRAGMILGHGSESYAICRDLALRLPVMVLPSWMKTRSEPIDIQDVVHALAHAVDLELSAPAWFDLPGPEVLSARQILQRIAACRGIEPLMIPVPFLSPGLSSPWLRLVSRANFSIARQLVDGLRDDMVCAGEGYWQHLPEHRLRPFDEAVQAALDEEGSGRRSARLWEGLVRRIAPRRGTASRGGAATRATTR